MSFPLLLLVSLIAGLVGGEGYQRGEDCDEEI